MIFHVAQGHMNCPYHLNMALPFYICGGGVFTGIEFSKTSVHAFCRLEKCVHPVFSACKDVA